MSKRRSDERGGGRILKKRPMRRHLYLVLDDWPRGYTIRKIDLLPDPVASYPGRQIITGGFLGKQRLPPAIIRVDAARGLPKHLVASGRHLMFMQPSDRWKEEPTFKFFPILDVAMRSTGFCRLPVDFPNRLPIDFPDDPLYMPAGGSIYILDRNCFFVLTPASPFDRLCPSPVPADLQKWNMLPNPPFERKHVISYAYYARTLFFMSKLNDDVFTFTFNIMEGRWDQKAMLMPFSDQTHFDPVLDAFVGLSKVPGSIGHIWLAYMDGSSKLSKEKLFSKDIPAEKQYDRNGDLRIVNLQVQYYNVPQGVTESALDNPAAFWM